MEKRIACIHKKPTPIQVVTVGKNSKITEAFFKTPSTTDYNGVYKSTYIDFEAKETNLESFPLSNILTHQINHLITINEMHGLAFIIVRFNFSQITFLLDIKDFIYFINTNSRKSIPYSFFLKFGELINGSYYKPLDYLNAVEKKYFTKE